MFLAVGEMTKNGSYLAEGFMRFCVPKPGPGAESYRDSAGFRSRV